MKEPIAMSLTCGFCGITRLVNTDPDVAHPLDFIEFAKTKGWTFPVNNAVQLSNACGPPRCPACTAKGK